MQTCEPRCLELQFRKQLALRVLTGLEIKGKENTPCEVALIDPVTDKVVDSGPEASITVEIVALRADFGDVHQGAGWTSEEFNENIVRERKDIFVNRDEKPDRKTKKMLLLGRNVLLKLNRGSGHLRDIMFRHYTDWMRLSKLKLGARIHGPTLSGMRIKEAVSEAFHVEDRRNTYYKKLPLPSLTDEVWRLKNIGRNGAFHRRLSMEGVKTVKDFLTLYFVDQTKLRKILMTSMSDRMLEITVNHARTCVLDKKLYLYYPSGSEHKKGVVFNVVGEVMGFVSDCQYITNDKMSETEKAHARDLVAAAYTHWADVVSINDEASLTDGSLFLSNPPMLVTSDVVFPEACGFSFPDTEFLDYSSMDLTGVGFDRPMSSLGKVENDTDFIDPAFCEDGHQQMFDLEYIPRGSTLGASTDMQMTVSGFIVNTDLIDKAHRRWKMLFSVLRWFSIGRIAARKSSFI
ncbi:hypothetical protein ACH5RR_025646 [Cinchona calisaya]|uniref:Calmodulin-binding protein n=1 Tax=Cinchona calisaya TaxID=153742 RepID=A0ABD2Z1C6_9GENT